MLYIENTEGIISAYLEEEEAPQQSSSSATGQKPGFFENLFGGVKNFFTKSGGSAIMESLNIGDLNPIRYRGYYWDDEIQMYYLHTRYYNPEWGRFLNADSLMIAGNALTATNMYAYCNGNPVNLADGSGQLGKLIKAAVGAVVGAGAGLVAGAKAGYETGGVLGAIGGGAAGAVTGGIAGAQAGAQADSFTEAVQAGAVVGAVAGAETGVVIETAVRKPLVELPDYSLPGTGIEAQGFFDDIVMPTLNFFSNILMFFVNLLGIGKISKTVTYEIVANSDTLKTLAEDYVSAFVEAFKNTFDIDLVFHSSRVSSALDAKPGCPNGNNACTASCGDKSNGSDCGSKPHHKSANYYLTQEKSTTRYVFRFVDFNLCAYSAGGHGSVGGLAAGNRKKDMIVTTSRTVVLHATVHEISHLLGAPDNKCGTGVKCVMNGHYDPNDPLWCEKCINIIKSNLKD